MMTCGFSAIPLLLFPFTFSLPGTENSELKKWTYLPGTIRCRTQPSILHSIIQTIFTRRKLMSWDNLFAARTGQMKRSTVREILKLTAQPDVISFAGGLPAPELFPVERIQQATDTVLSERGREALQYSTTEGMPELRALIAKRLSRGSFQISPANILIVSGSQQGLDLIAKILLDEGDRVIVENPTYVGMLTCWRPMNLDFLAVPTDHDGMQVEEIEALMPQNPKVIYSIPTFQNPQ